MMPLECRGVDVFRSKVRFSDDRQGNVPSVANDVNVLRIRKVLPQFGQVINIVRRLIPPALHPEMRGNLTESGVEHSAIRPLLDSANDQSRVNVESKFARPTKVSFLDNIRDESPDVSVDL